MNTTYNIKNTQFNIQKLCKSVIGKGRVEREAFNSKLALKALDPTLLSELSLQSHASSKTHVEN